MRDMIDSLIVVGAIFIGIPLATTTVALGDQSPHSWIDSVEHSVAFFDQHAWDEHSGSYFSEIAFDGQVKSPKRHLLALSRMIYGVSYASQFGAADLSRAKAAADFILANMVQRDALGSYFVSTVDGNDNPVKQEQLVVNEQAYGLGGLVALYDVTRNQELKQQIEELFKSFIHRFKDTSAAGGFYDLYDLHTAAPVKTKSYNSTVYVATSFLLEFNRVMGSFEGHRIAGELADIVVKHFLDVKTGWIFENFDAQWRPWSEILSGLPVDQALAMMKERVPGNQSWQFQEVDSELRSIGVVGHNFQAAWFLNRMALDDNYSLERRTRWAQGARTILRSMLSKEAVDRVHGGVFDVFQRETDQHMWHTNKSWWQQAEAILALTLAEKSGVLNTDDIRLVRDQAVTFYFENFIDRERGGEYVEVSKEGEPTIDHDSGQIKDKGLKGKSTYHPVELARYMLDYSSSR